MKEQKEDEQPMFDNLRHALTWSFVEAEKQFTGYSNTASIMRHCTQKGAGVSTSPDDLSQQEKKAQAMWVLDTVRMALNDFEQALIVLKYGQGSINFADAFVQVGLEYPKYEAHVVDLILCNIFQFDQTGRKWNHGSRGWQDYPTVVQIAEVAGAHRTTMIRWIDAIQKDIHGVLFAAELVLKHELNRKKVLKSKKVA